jgi:hypothetical protein
MKHGMTSGMRHGMMNEMSGVIKNGMLSWIRNGTMSGKRPEAEFLVPMKVVTIFCSLEVVTFPEPWMPKR